MITQLQIFDDAQLLDYTIMSEWELAARHRAARRKENYELCREIEHIVITKGKNMNLLKALHYWKPVGNI